MTSKNLFKVLSKAKDDCDCDHGHQSTWFSLALAVLPAVLPVLIDKLGDLLMRWLFDDKDQSETEVEEEDK